MSPLRMFGVHGRREAAAEPSPPAWSPNDVTDCAARYWAKGGVTEAALAVSQWDDTTGNAFHLTQASGTSQPTYNATGLNSKPTITFDGTTDYLLRSGIGGGRTQWGIWMVVKPITNLAYEPICWIPTGDPATGGDTNDVYPEVRNASTTELDFWTSGVGASNASGVGTFATGSVYRIVWNYNGTTLEMDINGVNVISQALAGRKIGDTLILASLRPFSTGFDLNVSISEFLIADSPISAPDKTLLESWYTQEWA